jgi:hypothetical protein
MRFVPISKIRYKAGSFQALEATVKRAMVHQQQLVRCALEGGGDCVAMAASENQRLNHQHLLLL